MASLGTRLRDARKAKDMKQSDLGQIIGESAATISNWERDQNKPDVDKLIRICQVLNIPPAELLGFQVAKDPLVLYTEEKKHIGKYRQLDLFGRDAVDAVLDVEYKRCTITSNDNTSYDAPPMKVRPIRRFPLPASAGTGIDLSGDNTEEAIYIPLTDVSAQADFVVPVSGDSMEPEYTDGDLLLIQSTPDIGYGQLGIYNLNGNAYFKKYEFDRLVSLNPKYSPIFLQDSDNISAFGRVLGKTHKVDPDSHDEP